MDYFQCFPTLYDPIFVDAANLDCRPGNHDNMPILSNREPMRILLANPRGFCAGVNMAIDVVEQVLKMRGAPVYVYHEIVHNRHVVDDFRRRGVVFVDYISEVPNGSVVVYSAHGISPAIRAEARNRSLVEVDASCPLVIKVHNEVQRFAKDGYHILFIGHAKHDEAVGTVGEAPSSITVVRIAGRRRSA